MRNRYFAAAAAIALLTSTSACDSGADPESKSVEAGQNIAKSLGSIDGLDTASDLINQAGLEQMLEGEAAYTLFLPNDQAFAKLPKGELDRLRSDDGRPDLIALLRQHMVPGMIARKDLGPRWKIQVARWQWQASLMLPWPCDVKVTQS